MKIFYLANIRVPTEKAHGLQIMKSCEALTDLGISVELVVPFRENTIKEDAFSYYKVKRNFVIKKVHAAGSLSSLTFVSSIAFHIQSVIFSLIAICYVTMRKEDGDILYSRDITTLFFTSLFGLKTVAEIHDYRLIQPSRIADFIFKKSWRIVLNSQGTLDKLKNHYKVVESKVMVVPNGVDINTFEINESRAQVRERLSMPLEGSIIAYVGRIETAGVDKGVGFLIEAFDHIKEQIPNVMLYVIGGPDELVGEDTNRIKFTGHVPYSLIPLYLKAVDLVVIPLPKGRHAETTSPIKLFEFMAAGKAIVAPNFASLRELVDDSSVSFFKPGDVEDLASTIKSSLENPEIMEAKAQKVKKMSREFTWHMRAEKILNFI